MNAPTHGDGHHSLFVPAAQQVALSDAIELRRFQGVKEGHRVALIEKLLHGIATVALSKDNNEILLMACSNEENYRLAKKLMAEFNDMFIAVKEKHDNNKKRVEVMYERIKTIRESNGLFKDKDTKIPGFLRDVKPMPRQPLSEGQAPLITSLADDTTSIIAVIAHFGSGKTYLPFAQGLEDIITGRRTKLIATRKESTVHKHIGFVPGTQHDKTKRDNHAAFENLVKVMMDWGVSEKDAIDKTERLIKPSKSLLPGQEIVEIVLPEQLEGRTIHDAVIILDEAHGIPTSLMRGILGRLGNNSKLIIVGDFHQINDKRLRQTHYDEDDGCGLAYAVSFLADSPNIDNIAMIVNMDAKDVHRSDATREVAFAMQAYAKKRGRFPVWQGDIDNALAQYAERKQAAARTNVATLRRSRIAAASCEA
ncbi:MAG: PhoH family protein [Alphaproteobacteria bacterium]|nr:PhoH family protein [Alphaproteobacteria bacterium]